MLIFKKVLILISAVFFIINPDFCLAENNSNLRPPLATSRTIKDWLGQESIYKTPQEIIDGFDLKDNIYWRHLGYDNASRELMLKRLKFLLEEKKFSDLVKARLKDLKQAGQLDLTDNDIENCSIFIFGDFLWHSNTDKPNDIDMLVIIENRNIAMGGVWDLFGQGFPRVAFNIRSKGYFNSDEEGRKNYALLKMGTGLLVYGKDPRIEADVSIADLLSWAEGLIQNGFMHDETYTGDLGSSRKEWKRFFEAYLYLYREFSENMPEVVTDVSSRFLRNQDLRSFLIGFYNENTEKDLPWRAISQGDLAMFGYYLKGRISELRLKLEKDGPARLKAKTANDFIRIERSRFPDGESYLRILNPDAVRGANVEVESCINSPQDLVEAVLLMDFLRYYGAGSVKLAYESSAKNKGIDSGLVGFLRIFCDSVAYMEGKKAEELSIDFPKIVISGEKIKSAWISHVLYQHDRLEQDALEAAGLLEGASHRKINIVKDSPNPLNWTIEIDQDLKGKDIALLHSSENSVDIAELWIMLVALRKAEARSVHVFNAYESYSRQDKVFDPGEGIGALTMLKALDVFTDNHFVLNVHYLDRTGASSFKGIEVYNVNAFVQLAEYQFDFIVRTLRGADIREEFIKHPLLLLAPDDGALQYVKEAADILSKYIKEEYGLDVAVHFGYMDKKRTSDTEVEIKGGILGEDGMPIAGIPNIKDCWALVTDDETSSGGTLFTATYVLNQEIGIAWQRILTGVVHGKLAMGLKPFETGLTEDDIRTAEESGMRIRPKKEYVNISKKRMPPRLFVCTSSVHLPDDFPSGLRVSIGPNIAHFIKRVVGSSAINRNTGHFL